MNKQGTETTIDITLKELIHTLLYEGYALYPYRGTALKNKTPIPFGIVYPEAYCMQNQHAHCEMQTECIVYGNVDTTLDVTVKFLQVSNKAKNITSSWRAMERAVNAKKINFKTLTGSITILPFRFACDGVQNRRQPHHPCI